MRRAGLFLLMAAFILALFFSATVNPPRRRRFQVLRDRRAYLAAVVITRLRS